jgi:hypothetical protein
MPLQTSRQAQVVLLTILLPAAHAAAQNTLTLPNGATNSGPSSVVIRGPLPDILFTEMTLGQNGARAALYLASAPTGETFGVWGQSASTTGCGVVGIGSAATGKPIGVKGIVTQFAGYAGYFQGGQSYFQGDVGFGVLNPTSAIHTSGDILIDCIMNQPELRTRRAQGTPTAPTTITANLSMLRITCQGYDGNSYDEGGSILVTADETWAVGAHGTRIAFHTTNIGSMNNLERMRIAPNGFVGINTTSPSERLHVAGNICATGTIGACSDARFKKNIAPIPNALEQLDQLHGVNFEWKRDAYPDHHFAEGSQIGFIAQEVAKVVPQLVAMGSDGYLSLDYGRLTPILVEALRELRIDNDCKHTERDQRLARLESENAVLKARLEKLESRLTQLAGR